MFEPLVHVSWFSGLMWLGAIALAAFLVAWIFSDLRPSKRVVYIPILAVVTGTLTAGYLIWSEAGTSFWMNNWLYGIIGAIVASALLTIVLGRQRIPGLESHDITASTIAWDGLVYGAAEGVLLSVLPVLVTWQMLSSNGWGSGWRSLAAAVAAIAASVAVIVVHHLGYPDFRRNRMKMRQAVLGCGVLSVGYLLTASVITPVMAHAVLHVVAVRKGMELPPHEEAPGPGSFVRSPEAA
jgi:hypothetical protein